MSIVLRRTDEDARAADSRRHRRDARRRGGGGHRQDDRAGEPHRPRARRGPRRRARDRRGDVHREGGGRAEAAASAAARRGAAACGATRQSARLDEAVQNLEEAHVSTIHGFCADLLRERPVEARVDPLFRVLTEGQARAAVRRGVRRWFQAQLEEPPEGVRRSLRRASRGMPSGRCGRGRPDRAAAPGRLRADRVARLPRAVDARAVRSRRARSRGSSSSCTRSPISRRRRRTPATTSSSTPSRCGA